MREMLSNCRESAYCQSQSIAVVSAGTMVRLWALRKRFHRCRDGVVSRIAHRA